MRYALDNNDKRVEVELSGQRAKCPICDSLVVGKKGEIKKKHWAHHRIKDCDSWYEPLTEWHLHWQNLFPEEQREVVISENGITHRADIQINNGMVIEIQNSPIPIKNIRAREEFYGKRDMIWILNGEKLTTKSELKIEEHPNLHYLIIDFPESLPNNPNYLTEAFYNEVLDIYLLSYIGEMSLTNNKIVFTSYNEIDEMDGLELIQLKFHIVSTYQYLYNHLDIEKFRDNLKIYGHKKLVNHKSSFLNKKYWRQFIDKMSFPVFIDNLKGLKGDELYWYQMNRVIKKENFIKKYSI